MKKNVFFGIILLTAFIGTLILTRPQTAESPPVPISVDLVVVGRGLPALAAALEANWQGAEVMILNSQRLREDFFYPLGGSFIATQKNEAGEGEKKFNEDLEAVLAHIMTSAPKTDRDNLREVLVESAATLAWLTEYQDLALTAAPLEKYRYYSPYFEDTTLLEERLWQLLKPRLIHNLEGAEPIAIEFSPAGEVKGMEISTDEGVIKVTARAVIIAAGGFSGNKAYLAEYNPQAARLDSSFRSEGAEGIALDLVKDIEADIVKAERIYFAPILFPAGKLIDKAWYPGLMQGIWLDRQGENITGSALAVLRTGSEKDVTDWFLSQAGQPFNLLFPGNREAVLPGLASVNSLSQLSSQTEIPLESLAEALAGSLPPYYLGTLELQPLYTMGGLAADAQGRILKHGAAIPGLYGAGETVGWLHGETIFPGLPLTEGLVMGRIVGREAASFAEK